MKGSGRQLARRIAAEHRRVLVPLAVALLVNVVAYAAIVYPLSQRVANIEEREETAARDLAAAREEHAQAEGTLTGKERAARELDRFYGDVLPRSLPAARELTIERVPGLAKQLNVDFYRRSTPRPAAASDSTLVPYRTRVELAGRYTDVRAFIHQLESSPEFVVIENITLAEETGDEGRLELQLDLATYYRAPAP